MSRRATIRTIHDDPELVARALGPDNTDEMETVVESAEERASDDDERGGEVVTRIERDSTTGLHSTVDDYVVNLAVAVDVAHAGRAEQSDQLTDTGAVSDPKQNTTQLHDE
ncbi:KEOPS complex subunit Pcc1 [Natrarchaeobius oligotrophus]|uniref:KEOPS complex Pcc1-like subunit n=1 Tax=Natrarchaeobius chitinivorans TaxID=1679083 RepID=A0A3N6MLJ2_NATCH|nr:KEOPS complex subunit Pcc1 [Natrarchaeobius chitinivorans]RQG98180.1 KEOPS complex Pcc1-like subunit [Natrarchaeobius chitinivorans]